MNDDDKKSKEVRLAELREAMWRTKEHTALREEHRQRFEASKEREAALERTPEYIARTTRRWRSPIPT